MNSLLTKILGFLGLLLAGIGLKYRGDLFKAKAEKEKAKAEAFEGNLDDIKKANSDINDPDERERVRRKYTRKK